MRDLTDSEGGADWAALLEPASAVLADCGRWGRGRLCMTGGPLERTFASHGEGVRVTLEPCNPDVAPVQRSERALNWLSTLGANPARFNRAWREAALEGQRQRPDGLRFGAWLGLRHKQGVFGAKLYLEAVPTEALTTLLSGALGPEQLAGLPGQPSLIGLGSDGTCEVYFASRDIPSGALERILAPAGQATRAFEARECLSDLAQMRATARLPVRDIGFSFGLSVDGQVGPVSLFATSLGLFGRDRVAADRLQETAAQLGGDMTEAAETLRSLPALPPGVLHCGMVGMTFQKDAPLVLSAGVALDPAALAK